MRQDIDIDIDIDIVEGQDDAGNDLRTQPCVGPRAFWGAHKLILSSSSCFHMISTAPAWSAQ
eukprot:scaffold317062_cov18-Tisochrysis_lutea.AAC.1